MPKPRSSKSTLFEVMNNAVCPLYILDQQGQILFANEPLCKWLNMEFDLIKMVSCQPTTDRTERQPEDAIRGLAVPPTAYQERISQGKVFRTAADRHLIWRSASFTRLSGTNEVRGNILVTLSNEDQSIDAIPEHPTSWVRQVIADLRTFETQRYGFDHFIGLSPQAQRLNKQIQVACKTDCNLTLVGPVGSGLAELGRLIHQARWNDQKASLTEIPCPMADAQSIQNTILQIQRERNKEATSNWLMLVDAEKLSEQAAHELCGFLQLPNHNLKIISLFSHLDSIAAPLLSFLNIQEVNVPALRDRKTDIPILASYLLKLHSRNDVIEFNLAAQQALVDYNWPCNLEELEQTVSEIASRPEQDVVALDDFPDRFKHALQAQQIGGSQVTQIDLDGYLASIEAKLIGRAMQQANNNKAKACKLLGISRAKLGRRIQVLGIGEDDSDPIIFEESLDNE